MKHERPLPNDVACCRCKESIECDGSENWAAQIDRFIEKHSQCTETYWKGDRARYTGETEKVYGKTWYVLEMLEGIHKGKRRVTGNPPVKPS